MKKLTISFAVLAIGFLCIGCSLPRMPISGGLYADVSDAMGVGTGDVSAKKGEATATGIVGITTGDSSIATAAAAGGITKIGFVDYHSMTILGVYSKTTTVVYGQ